MQITLSLPDVLVVKLETEAYTVTFGRRGRRRLA